MSMDRSSFKKRGTEYTSKAVTMRCVGPDQTGATITLHYLNDGTARVRMTVKKAEVCVL
jgi:DNA-directed RNA polymerase I subunit RPA2